MKKSGKDTDVVSVRVPKKIKARFQAYANKDNRTLSSAILHLAERMLDVVTPR